MVDLPKVSRSLVTTEQPTSTLSRSDLSEPYTDLAHAMDEVSGGLNTVAKTAAKEAGLRAVARDEDGNITVQRWPIVGDAAVEYQRAVKTAAVTDAEAVIRRDHTELRQQFRDDPAGYLQASEEYRARKVQQYSAAGTEVGMTVGHLIDREVTANHRGLLNEKERLDMTRATRSIESEIAVTQNEMAALANGGDTSSEAFTSRAAKVRTLYGELVNNPRLAFPQQRADAELAQMDSELRARATVRTVTQVYEREGFDAAVRAADRLRTDTGLNLTPQQRDTYYSRAIGELNRLSRAQDQNARSVVSEIQAADRIAADGLAPSPERLAALRQSVAAANNPQLSAAHDAMVANLPVVAAWRQMSPVQLEAELAQLDRTMRGPGGTDERTIALRNTGAALLAKMRTELGSNPLGWANRSGTVQVPPIDFASDHAADNMRQRAVIAETAARHYGVAPQYLMPEERQALAAATASGGPAMQQVAQMIVSGFGARSSAVLAEVAPQAPVLAHVGGLLSGGLFGAGSTTFANDVTQGVALLQNPETKKTLPHWAQNPTDRVHQFETTRRVDQYGDAFLLVPENGRAAEQSARSAFIVRAQRNGFDPTPQSQDLTGAATAYNRALQEGAGATFSPDGTQYGGVVDYRIGNYYGFRSSHRVLVPGTVRTDRFRDAINAIRDDDLRLMPTSPQAADGRVYTARDLQNAVPVAVPGGYRFAAGDPRSSDPKWIRGADGRPFVLDFDAMTPTLQKRVPGAFIGSR